MAKIRRPSVAGAFYEGNAESLKTQIEDCFLHKFGPKKIPKVTATGQRKIVGLICPHAGYEYSGPVAANAYYELALDGKPDIVVILGPNHRLCGSPIAVMNEGFWNTPLGNVEVDGEIASQIVRESNIVDVDDSAHLREHSIEVQLPFLQYVYGLDFKIVPICFYINDLQSIRDVGQAIAKVLAGKNAVIIASSDMTHHEPQKIAENKDRMALETVIALDEVEFYSTIATHDISVCGYDPIATIIVAAKSLGVEEAKLLSYKTSGDMIGDYFSVVGYAAVSFKK